MPSCHHVTETPDKYFGRLVLKAMLELKNTLIGLRLQLYFLTCTLLGRLFFLMLPTLLIKGAATLVLFIAPYF